MEPITPSEKPHREPDYRGKTILAPMVRVVRRALLTPPPRPRPRLIHQGTLPMRLLALQHGADIVYSEEIIDKAMLGATRVVNEVQGTIDFFRSNGNPIFRTNDADFPNVFQVGSSDATTALQACSLVSRDVHAIDVNMGCPKHFSVHAGMGAALLGKPEVAADILKTLVRNLNNPITCKIRLKDTVAETIDFMRLAEQCGVKAVAVHGRRIPERPRDKAHWDLLKEVTSLHPVSVPIIANGDVWRHEDIARCLEETGADSVMVARGACRNVTAAFSPTPLPVRIFLLEEDSSLLTHQFEEVMKAYTRIAIDVDNWWTNTKYCLLYMAKETNQWLNRTEQGRTIHTSKKFDDIVGALGLNEHYGAAQKIWDARKAALVRREDAASVSVPLSDMRGEVLEDEQEIMRVLLKAEEERERAKKTVRESGNEKNDSVEEDDRPCKRQRTDE